MFSELVALYAGLFFVVFSFVVEPSKNFVSKLLFKAIPFIFGMLLLVSWASLRGWLVIV